MKRSRTGRGRKGRRPPRGGPRRGRGTRLPSPEAVSHLLVAVLLLAVAFVFVPTAADVFRGPKGWVGGWLALASLLPLAALPARRERIGGEELSAFLASPVVAAAAPFFLVAAASLAWSTHPVQTREALADLAIGSAAVVGWSLGLGAGRLRRLLDFVLVPAAALALVAVLQAHGLYNPFELEGGEEGRMAVLGLAGNVGELGTLLAFAAVLAQDALRRRLAVRSPAWSRAVFAALLALLVYALLATQTLTALAGFAAGTLVYWTLAPAGLSREAGVPRGRLARLGSRRWSAAAVAALTAGALFAAALAVAPLGARLETAGEALARGDVDVLLTGRLDGWRAAAQVFAEHPLGGAGHGTYGSEFAPAKLELADAGVEFYRGHAFPMFTNAHSEPLEVAAETGLAGLAALAWGLFVLGRALLGLPAPRERSLGVALAVLLAVVSLAHFPWRSALTAYPALVALAWILAPRPGESAEAGEGAA